MFFVIPETLPPLRMSLYLGMLVVLLLVPPKLVDDSRSLLRAAAGKSGEVADCVSRSIIWRIFSISPFVIPDDDEDEGDAVYVAGDAL